MASEELKQARSKG